MNTVDLKLAQQLASKDEVVFSQFYSKNKNKIMAICHGFFRAPEDAEDMVQEVFIQIVKKVHMFKGESALATWIHRVAVNQCLMKLRVLKKRILIESVSEDNEEHDALLEGESKHPSYDLQIDIKEAINKLPQGYKNVFILHDLEGFEHQEIAQMLGCAEGTCKSQLFKARQKMRKVLNKKTNPQINSVSFLPYETKNKNHY